MGRKSKSHLPPSMLRGIVAANVSALRDRHYAVLPSVTARNRKLAEDIGTTLSQLQRIVAGTVGTSIDQIETLSKRLKCRPQDLLTPYYMQAMDSTPPLGTTPLARGELHRPPSGRHSIR